MTERTAHETQIFVQLGPITGLCRLCRVCPGGAEPGAKGRRKVAWMGLWWLFWAFLLYLLDLAAITGVNLKMIKDLAEVYGVPFRPELAKSAVSSLLASAGGGALLIGPVASLLKAVPGVGSVVGGLASPGVMGGMTYATGKVFARHFSTGGDLINFDASRFKDMFKRESKAGEAKAAQTTPGAEAAAGA